MNSCLLLSGGVDSLAICYWLRPTLALTVDYGQAAAEAEVEASQAICDDLGIQHRTIEIDCTPIGSGVMLPGAENSGVAPTPEWWPFRNQLLLSIGAAVCVKLGLSEVIIGSVRSDAEHSDGRPEFLDLIGRLISMQEGHVRVRAPAIALSTTELVLRSRIPNSLLAWAHSCHVHSSACGKCRGCRKLLAVWRELEAGGNWI